MHFRFYGFTTSRKGQDDRRRELAYSQDDLTGRENSALGAESDIYDCLVSHGRDVIHRVTATQFRSTCMPAGHCRRLVGKTLRNVCYSMSLKFALSVD